jgi:hypothetical protein
MAEHDWPVLRFNDWRETCETLHMWSQLVGKVRLALEPPVNHWWHVALYVSARGLTTSAMPLPDRLRRIELEFDFIDHALVARSSDGRSGRIALRDQSVSDFYRELSTLLDSVDAYVRIWPVPVEVVDATRFDADTRPRKYDRDAGHRFWKTLMRADLLMRQFRSHFMGKVSPVHFFWGGFDLAVTRFSGRTAPTHPGGVPNVGDWVMHDAYSHEVSSCGFWPGGALTGDAAFYAYAYPEPQGFSTYPVDVDGAHYDTTLREYLLPYETVRLASDPDSLVSAFLQRTYEAAAVAGGWDRTALEK